MLEYQLLFQNLLDMIMGSTIVKCAATDLGIQWAGWAIAAALKTEKFYDLAGNNTWFKPTGMSILAEAFCLFCESLWFHIVNGLINHPVYTVLSENVNIRSVKPNVCIGIRHCVFHSSIACCIWWISTLQNHCYLNSFVVKQLNDSSLPHSDKLKYLPKISLVQHYDQLTTNFTSLHSKVKIRPGNAATSIYYLASTAHPDDFKQMFTL